ncbi:MAG: hypothetical protein HOO96_22120 [Polyangiaceae bacterium]|nr:hypothetical protein [Polyangiaceae bacterium]
MSDEFLKALGRAGRRERDGADAAVVDAPVLDEAVKERMVVAALDALREGRGSAAKPLPERAPPELREVVAERTEPDVGPVAGATTRRRPLLARAGVVSAVLLAASLALFVGLRKDPLPAYSASVRGGTQEWRGEPPPGAVEVPLVVRGDGELEIILRPAEPVKRPLHARAFAVKGEAVRALPVEVSAQGTARVVGRADVLLGPAPEGIGPWRVTLFVGDSVPETLREAQSRDDLRRVVVPVTVVTAPSAP